MLLLKHSCRKNIIRLIRGSLENAYEASTLWSERRISRSLTMSEPGQVGDVYDVGDGCVHLVRGGGRRRGTRWPSLGLQC